MRWVSSDHSSSFRRTSSRQLPVCATACARLRSSSLSRSAVRSWRDVSTRASDSSQPGTTERRSWKKRRFPCGSPSGISASNRVSPRHSATRARASTSTAGVSAARREPLREPRRSRASEHVERGLGRAADTNEGRQRGDLAGPVFQVPIEVAHAVGPERREASRDGREVLFPERRGGVLEDRPPEDLPLFDLVEGLPQRAAQQSRRRAGHGEEPRRGQGLGRRRPRAERGDELVVGDGGRERDGDEPWQPSGERRHGRDPEEEQDERGDRGLTEDGRLNARHQQHRADGAQIADVPAEPRRARDLRDQALESAHGASPHASCRRRCGARRSGGTHVPDTT